MALKLSEKVAWAEGLLMLPQHLQQIDRYHEQLLFSRLEGADPLNWGALRIELDLRALAQGIAGLVAFEGVLPDGTPLSLNAQGGQRLPVPRAVQGHFPASQEYVSLFLALPIERAGVSNYAQNGEALRYVVNPSKLYDVSTDDRSDDVALAMPNAILLFGDESRDGFAAIKIAEIVRDGRGDLALSEAFIPPCLRVSASRAFGSRLERLLALMSTRHRVLTEARRVTNDGRAEFNAADVTRYLQLHALNSMFPSLNYVARAADISPRTAFFLLSQLAGQLATFSTDADMTQPMEFDFLDLKTTFRRLFELNERLLSSADNERFLSVTLQPHEGGRYFGDLANVRLDTCNRFLISVESTLPRPQVVQEFVRRAKVASHDDMDIVVSTSVGGINMAESRDPPPELPVKPGLVYFDLPARGNDVYWKHVVNDRNLVVWLPPTLDHDKPSVKLLGTFGARNA
jgi:type VI secretion system protein ImpJ